MYSVKQWEARLQMKEIQNFFLYIYVQLIAENTKYLQ